MSPQCRVVSEPTSVRRLRKLVPLFFSDKISSRTLIPTPFDWRSEGEGKRLSHFSCVDDEDTDSKYKRVELLEKFHTPQPSCFPRSESFFVFGRRRTLTPSRLSSSLFLNLSSFEFYRAVVMTRSVKLIDSGLKECVLPLLLWKRNANTTPYLLYNVPFLQSCPRLCILYELFVVKEGRCMRLLRVCLLL